MMNALLFTGPRRIEVQNRPVPSLRAGHCLIRVAYLGICGADAAFYKGSSFYLKQGLKSYPFIFGHEWSGTIVDIAEDVIGSKRGDRVVGHNFATEAPAAFERLISPNRARPKLAISFEGGSASLSNN
jgi:threonine dehydrogenase-like Zn-dependent dehydrogenase